jgi:glycosyltransferase involved in cell wall biosynthesis
MPTKLSISVSVLIPTWNEERNIAETLASVAFSDDIVVLDSFSDDRTVSLATEAGATVISRVFDNFSAQKNWALKTHKFKYEWILLVDADERVDDALAREIAKVVEEASHTGFFIPRKNIFMKTWLRWGGMYPDYQMRLFRVGRARFEKRIVHEHVILDGTAGQLVSPLLHNDYKGIERYIDRHNHYSSLEAIEAFNLMTTQGRVTIQDEALLPSPRRRLKIWSYEYLPVRWLAVFFYMYIFRLGFLHGRVGLNYCILRALYELHVDLKLAELKQPHSAMQEQYAELLIR